MSQKEKKNKGIVGYVKHLAKDPVNNIAEAEARIKELRPMLFISVGIAIALIVIGTLTHLGFISAIAIIPGVVIVFSGFLTWTAIQIKKKFMDIECPKCNVRIPYGPNVKYEVANTTYKVDIKEKVFQEVRHRFIIEGVQRSDLAVKCTCPTCGTEKSFTKNFVVVECKIELPDMVIADTSDKIVADTAVKNAKKEVENAPKNNFDEENGLVVTYRKTHDQLLEGYFGNYIRRE